MEQLTFRLEAYEGPLDLLLSLIQKNKVNIYDIPIAVILEQYMQVLTDMKGFDLEISSEFLVLAATLLNIKSKMLLPKHEEEEEEDPREELVKRLIEYQQYKEAAQFLGESLNNGNLAYFREPQVIPSPERKFDISRLTTQSLLYAFREAYNRLERRTPPPPEAFTGIVGHEKVSIRDKVKSIWNKLVFGTKVIFVDIFRGSNSRTEIVAVFLAVLELMKLKKIDVSYDEHSSGLMVNKLDNDIDFDIIGDDEGYGVTQG